MTAPRHQSSRRMRPIVALVALLLGGSAMMGSSLGCTGVGCASAAAGGARPARGGLGRRPPAPQPSVARVSSTAAEVVRASAETAQTSGRDVKAAVIGAEAAAADAEASAAADAERDLARRLRIREARQPSPESTGLADDGASKPAAGWLTSIRYKTWIWQKPHKGGKYLGYMRIGQRLAMKTAEKVPGMGCSKGFFAVEPRGYVCHDRTITLADETPFLKANAHTLPKPGPLPYRYAISNGAPMYARLPTLAEQKRNEARYGKVGDWIPLPPFSRGHEHLATTQPIAPDGAIPPFLAGGDGARGKPLSLLRRSLPHGSMMAFTRAFDVEGRTFLLSTDLTVVPADRVRAFRRSRFEGVRLGAKTTLPIAWIRGAARARYQLLDGALQKTAETYAPQTHVALSGVEKQQARKRYLEVSPAGSDLFIAAEDATVVTQRERLPFGVRPGDKWIIVSITQGTLVAYKGETPVFTTLISPGQGGLPRKGGDAVKDSTTPLGSYRITFKDSAATMSPEMGEGRSFWIADVPHVQYFNAPFALHAAYWHDKFGEPMSGGCVNLSPRDARWLFGWSDPQLPSGWQGISGSKGNGATTAVIVIR